MILRVCSVYDDKAQFFNGLLLAKTDGEAIRSFSSAVQSPGTLLNDNPNDFKLYHIGYLDDNSGQLDPVLPPQLLATGGECIVKNT